MKEINEVFRKYLEEAIGAEKASVAFSALDEPASVSVRDNPFKKHPAVAGERVPWCPDGHLLQERPSFTLDPFFHAGCYYVQDSSSMFVGEMFRQVLRRLDRPDGGIVRVLDLCAAPGGKTTDLSASLRQAFGDRFVLVSNEVMKNRVSVLADNVALWGDPSVVVTSDDPSAFKALEGYFDIILTDVPCSGEGMFRKDEEAVAQWSADNVSLCAARQKRILADVWPSLAEGGSLIYSTCTFNRHENDGNVDWIVEELGAERRHFPETAAWEEIIPTASGYSLVPGFVRGEGQYCAVLTKTSAASAVRMGKTRLKEVKVDIGRYFKEKMVALQKGDLIKAVPAAIAQEVAFLSEKLHVLSSGCAAGRFKGRDFVPDADLALSILLADDAFPRVEVDLQTALQFLHRDALKLPDMGKGYVILCREGVPLGFVKNLGNRCNNLHPQERRIRMDINI